MLYCIRISDLWFLASKYQCVESGHAFRIIQASKGEKLQWVTNTWWAIAQLQLTLTFSKWSTAEPLYNEVLGTMKITLLYQVSHYIRVKKQRNIKSWDQQNYLVIRGFRYIRPRYNEVPLYHHITTLHTHQHSQCVSMWKVVLWWCSTLKMQGWVEDGQSLTRYWSLTGTYWLHGLRLFNGETFQLCLFNNSYAFTCTVVVRKL